MATDLFATIVGKDFFFKRSVCVSVKKRICKEDEAKEEVRVGDTQMVTGYRCLSLVLAKRLQLVDQI